jgi:replicative superfamily II helicase
MYEVKGEVETKKFREDAEKGKVSAEVVESAVKDLDEAITYVAQTQALTERVEEKIVDVLKELEQLMKATEDKRVRKVIVVVQEIRSLNSLINENLRAARVLGEKSLKMLR